MSTVLLTAPLQPDLNATLVEHHGAVPVPGPGEPGRAEALVTVSGGARVAVTTARFGIDAATLEALPDLEAVVSFGVGTDALDLDAARERGVVVSTTPGVLTDAVADLAVGLVIDVLRGVSAADRHVRAGRWPTEGAPPLARQVTGRRVGIVGMGRIGLAVAERLSGFRCELGHHNRRPVEGDVPWFASVGDLADWADVLVVAAPGSDRPLVGADELQRLGRDGVVVNVGRGSVIDEQALVEALETGRIAGAGLDVFVDEPHVPSALLDRDDVVVLPHVGSATRETRAAMSDLVLRNVEAWLETGRLVTPLW